MVFTEIGRPDVSGTPTRVQGTLFGSAPLGACQPASSFAPLDDRSSVLFEPSWLAGSNQLFDELYSSMGWKALERPMYDRVVAVPRLICNVELSALDPHHSLQKVTSLIAPVLGRRPERVGLNLYRNGDDSVAWHRDRLGSDRRPSMVALVSLGAPRTLAMRPCRSPIAEAPQGTCSTRSTRQTARRWRLGHGDLLVMAGACQRSWEHCVPKERAEGPRISLAFRI